MDATDRSLVALEDHYADIRGFDTRRLLAAGARKVYAAARNPETITLDGVERVRLEVTQRETIAAAALTVREQ